MNVKVEALDQHKVKVTVEVPAADVVKGYKQAVSRFANQIRLKGFRKGKAPRKVLEMYLGKEAIEGEAKEIVFNRALEQALQDEKLVPVTQPEVKDESFSEKDGSTFTATFVKRPEVKLGEYKNLDAKHAEPVVTDDDVMAQLKQLAENNARLEVVEGAELKDGDFAIIDFKGTVNGEAFEGGEGKAYPLEIGSGSFIPGFEDQLKGHKAGDDVTVKVTFPANYFVKDLAGKEAEFAVHVNDVKQKVLPEINDEFAKSISKQDSLKDLMETMKAEMQGRATFQANQAYRQALVDLAVANAQVDIPQEMIDTQIQNMIRDFDMQMRYQGMDLQQYMKYTGTTADMLKEQFKDDAAKRVKTSLILEKICEVEGIDATDKDVEKEYQKTVESSGMKLEDVKKYIPEGDIKDRIKAEKTIKFLVDNANFK